MIWVFSDHYGNEWFTLVQILSILTYIYRPAVTLPVKYLAGKAHQQIKTFGPLITFVKHVITAYYGDEYVKIDISKTNLNVKKNLIEF